jgi:hypothetical protein
VFDIKLALYSKYKKTNKIIKKNPLKITAENTNESHQNTTALVKEFVETNLRSLQNFVNENNQVLYFFVSLLILLNTFF